MKKLKILIIVLLAALLTGSLKAQNTFSSTTPGTTTWTCPADVTSVTIECWGGGGAGGSVQTLTNATITSRACGGAGGSYAKITLTNLVPGTAYTYTVGAGGVAAIPTIASIAASGESTTFNTSTVVAVGGPGASNLYDQTSIGAAGKGTALLTGNTGDVVFYGGNGGVNAGTGAGGGGGSAGTASAGNAAGTAPAAGAAVTGGGAGGNGSAAATGVGTSGSIPGGGGGGAVVKTTANTSRLAGSGANGKIFISWITNVASVNPIAFATATFTKTYGNADFTPTFSVEVSDGAITFSSSNTAVATVDASTGLVHIVGAGTATITADQAAGTGYLAGSTSCSVVVTGLITATTPSPSQLFYEAGGTSGEATFTVTGGGLTNNVTVTPASNLEISLSSGTGFVGSTSSLTLTQSGGSLVGAPVTIYVRLKSGISPGGTGTSISKTVTLTSTNATTTTAVLGSGWITGLQINNTGTSSTYALGAGPGTEKSFTVIGAGLETSTQVSLAFGSNIEITTTAGDYTTSPVSSPVSLVITPGALPNPKITNTTYYYRLKSGLALGTYADATTKVSISADGSSSLTGAFTTKELQVTGTVSATVSAAQNISDLAFSGAATLNVADGGELNINQNSSLVTMNVSPLGKVTLPDNTTLTSTSITLQSNAGGTATFVDLNNTSPQTVTGTVQQYLTAERNWYTSSPITAGTAAGLNRGTSVQTYSEATKGWTVLTGSDALVNGKGYVSVATTNTGTLTPGTVSFNGTLNSGTVTVPVTRTESGSSIGFNLVANPYPSYLDWSLVTADGANANIGTTMWFRTKTAGGLYTFSTYNSAGNVATANSATTTISKFIPPMQAFWIRVNSGTASTNLTFKNSMRAHKDDNGNTFKAPKLNTQQLLRLQISNGTYSDEAVVYFNTNASNAFDTYDSQKMFESASAVKPEIFTQVDTEKLVINGLNTIPYNTEIPLGLVTKQAGNFSIAANELLNFESGTRLILKDKQNPAIETELTPETVYNFSSPITAASTDRFSLIFRAPGTTTGVNNVEKLNAQVFVNAANQITIIAPVKSNYAIYNAVGQLIENGVINTEHETRNTKREAGVYVVKVNNQSTRVIVK